MSATFKRALVVALLALSAVQASAQYYFFLGAEDDEWEATNGLMTPPGAIVLFYDSQGPMSFVTMSPKELPADAVGIGDVYAKTCQYGLGIPLTPPASLTGSGPSISGVKGNGGYQRTLNKLKAEHPGLRGLYDLRLDDQYTSILIVFRRLCTEITARGFR